jgi:hypothetical protein
MTPGQPSSPELRRPWFYQNWFLIGAFILGWPIAPQFILWPVGAVLVIRSPWHGGTPIRVLAWTMLLTGAGMLTWRLQNSPNTLQVAVMAMPGLLLTAVTQALWVRYRADILAASKRSTLPAAPAELPLAAPRRNRSRRRVHRRRGSGSGRSPRQPS